MTPPILAMLEGLLPDGEQVDLALITPRFRTSRNVVLVLIGRQSGRPVAVAKIPRFLGSESALAHEARVLDALHAARAGGFATAPRVLALERWAGRPVLVESALVGMLVDGHDVRRRPAACIEDLLGWLYELPIIPPGSQEQASDHYQRLVARPLADLLATFQRQGCDDIAVIERTLELLDPLRTEPLPLVFEHGDLNYPNIIRLEEGGVGVIDWELGEEKSFPARDLFFFLAFVAFALARAQTRREELAALHDAYLAPDAWARQFAAGYADRLGFDRSLLTPLFLACWARHAASWLVRLGNAGQNPLDSIDADGSELVEPAAAAYIQGNLSFAFWKDALERLDALRWE